jgi:hypothetical protein
MDDLYDYETITYETFSELLESYTELVPSKLAELEEQRLETIPKALSERADDALEEGRSAEAGRLETVCSKVLRCSSPPN